MEEGESFTQAGRAGEEQGCKTTSSRQNVGKGPAAQAEREEDDVKGGLRAAEVRVDGSLLMWVLIVLAVLL